MHCFAIYYELNLLNVSEEIRYFYSVSDGNTINNDIYRNILAKLEIFDILIMFGT